MKPILMSTPMVQATLDGRKTVTRRTKGLEAVNINPDQWGVSHYQSAVVNNKDGLTRVFFNDGLEVKCPYGWPSTMFNDGSILWVRETFRPIEQDFGSPRYEYKATEKINLTDKWKPSIFMPFDACRIFLEIVSIRVERLQDITEEDAVREGVKFHKPVPGDGLTVWKNYTSEKNPFYGENARLSFKTLWQSINGKDSWDQNPWVWRTEFKRVDKPAV